MNVIQEYFSRKDCLSNSTLKMLDNPRWLKWKMDNPDVEDGEKKHFRVGSALDCLLTDPENWETEFEVVDSYRPFGYMGKFIDNLEPNLTPLSGVEEFQEAYEKAGYKMKIETVVGKFWSNAEAVKYYTQTRNLDKGKSILSKDEFDTVVNMKELILANPFINKYFMNTSKDVEIKYQMPIYFEYMGEKCKSLLDGVMINHKEKWIQPFDLKSIGKGINNFPSSYLMYGYYTQAAFYTLAFMKWIETQSLVTDYSEYEMRDFQFIVVESKLSSSHPAIIYQCTKNDLDVGMNGGVCKRTGKTYRGINQFIEAYKWHTQHDKWDLPMDLYLNEGKIILNAFDDKDI